MTTFSMLSRASRNLKSVRYSVSQQGTKLWPQPQRWMP